MEQQEVILLIAGFNMAKDTIKITTKVAKTSHLQKVASANFGFKPTVTNNLHIQIRKQPVVDG